MQIRDRIRELRRVPASDLRPNPRNWRTHPAEQADVLKGVLAEVGMADAILCRELEDGSLQIIDGHLRAETLGASEVPVLVLDVSADEADKILLTLDPLSAMAGRDDEMLKQLLLEVETQSDAVKAMLEALQPQVQVIESQKQDDPGAKTDRAAELQAKWGVEPGQIWTIGEHRLLCGDATSSTDMDDLMTGAVASMCFTSPPYNAAPGRGFGSAQKYIDGYDDSLSSDGFRDLLCSVAGNVMAHCQYAFFNIQSLAANKIAILEWLHSMREWYADTAIWDKMTAEPAMNPRVMDSRWEYIHILSKEAKRSIGTREFRGGVHNIFSLQSRRGKAWSDVHKATYPVELPSWGIETFSNAGEIILEPFCGTGTTMVAAHSLGRMCYAMEIDPRYAAVTIERMSEIGLTPRKAERHGHEEG